MKLPAVFAGHPRLGHVHRPRGSRPTINTSSARILCPQEGVPRGKIVPLPPFESKIYAGTTRTWWLYVPAQYDGSKPACVMVFQDGGEAGGGPNQAGPLHATYAFDNLIAAKEMPVTVGIFISPGTFPATGPGGKPRSNRSVEYDTPDATFSRFLLEEILPEVGRSSTGSPTSLRSGRSAAGAAGASAPSRSPGNGRMLSRKWSATSAVSPTSAAAMSTRR